MQCELRRKQQKTVCAFICKSTLSRPITSLKAGKVDKAEGVQTVDVRFV